MLVFLVVGNSKLVYFRPNPTLTSPRTPNP